MYGWRWVIRIGVLVVLSCVNLDLIVMVIVWVVMVYFEVELVFYL